MWDELLSLNPERRAELANRLLALAAECDARVEELGRRIRAMDEAKRKREHRAEELRTLAVLVRMTDQAGAKDDVPF